MRGLTLAIFEKATSISVVCISISLQSKLRMKQLWSYLVITVEPFLIRSHCVVFASCTRMINQRQLES